MSVYQEVTLALYVQVFEDFGWIEHDSTGGAIKHGVFLGKDIVLNAYSIGCQEEDSLLAEYHRLKSMDPIIVSSSNITVHYFSFLAIHPIGEKQQDIALGLYHIICDFPLVGREVFWVDVHANGKRASDCFVLGSDEIEVSEFAAFLCPQFVIVVEVTFTVVKNELACPVYNSCRVEEKGLPICLFSLDIPKGYISLGLFCNFFCEFEVDPFILPHRKLLGFFGSCEVVANKAHFREDNDVKLTLRCVSLQ